MSSSSESSNLLPLIFRGYLKTQLLGRITHLLPENSVPWMLANLSFKYQAMESQDYDQRETSLRNSESSKRKVFRMTYGTGPYPGSGVRKTFRCVFKSAVALCSPAESFIWQRLRYMSCEVGIREIEGNRSDLAGDLRSHRD